MHPLTLEILRITAWLFLICAVFVPLERLLSIKPQAVFRRQFFTDLSYYALNSILIGMLLGAPLAMIGAILHQIIPSVLLHAIANLPVGARLGLALLVAEVGSYWGHRLSHQIPLLWRFHAIHHSAEDVDFLTNSRAHPFDMVFIRLCSFVPVVALGFASSTAVPALVLVLGTLWGYFIHANLRWRFGFLEYLIATPFFHRWHHTKDARRDHNYAAMLPFIDVIFGTYLSPDHWPTSYGTDNPMPASIGHQLVKPFLPSTPEVGSESRRERHPT